MELTTATFRNLEDDLTERQRITVRAAIGDGVVGVLPDTERNVEGGFVGRSYEMPGLRLTALIASGSVLSLEEDLRIEIPRLTGTEYYLCVRAADDKSRTFERDGILYETPEYELSLHDANDPWEDDSFPLKHMTVADGTLTVDEDYIIPCLSLKGDTRFSDYRDRIASALEAIATHKNMDEGDCKRTLLYLLFRLRSFSMERSVRDFVDLLQEIALAIRYYVVEGLGKTVETSGKAEEGPVLGGSAAEESPVLGGSAAELDDPRSVPSQYDIAKYLKWIGEYLDAQQELMALVVIEDNSIDYDRLKSELHEEIYGKLYDELYNKLRQQLHDSLTTELTDSIMNAVRELIDGHLHPELHRQLNDELHDPLYQSLYDALYNALYDVLYKPMEKAKDEFMPLI